MIPAEAVEAAAKVHQDLQVKLGFLGWDKLNHIGQEWRLEHMRAALEAAAPHLLVSSPVVTDEMVDAVLEHDGTPRRRLFEYPHRDDDSREMIRSAEALVRRILNMRPTNV